MDFFEHTEAAVPHPSTGVSSQPHTTQTAELCSHSTGHKTLCFNPEQAAVYVCGCHFIYNNGIIHKLHVHDETECLGWCCCAAGSHVLASYERSCKSPDVCRAEEGLSLVPGWESETNWTRHGAGRSSRNSPRLLAWRSSPTWWRCVPEPACPGSTAAGCGSDAWPRARLCLHRQPLHAAEGRTPAGIRYKRQQQIIHWWLDSLVSRRPTWDVKIFDCNTFLYLLLKK